jgi:hypothetical protein
MQRPSLFSASIILSSFLLLAPLAHADEVSIGFNQNATVTAGGSIDFSVYDHKHHILDDIF